MVDSALISGLTPNLTDDQMRIGSVVAPGPAENDAITKSSSERVNANSQPEIMAGRILGSVTS